METQAGEFKFNPAAHHHGRPCKKAGHTVRYSRSPNVCVLCSRVTDKSPARREKQKAARKLDYEKNKKRILGWQSRYRETPRGRARGMLAIAKARAKKKSCAMDLDIDWIAERVASGVCSVSGLPFVLDAACAGGPYTPSLDRKDATKGYTKDNVRVVLLALNTAFGPWGDEEFAPIAKAFLENR